MGFDNCMGEEAQKGSPNPPSCQGGWLEGRERSGEDGHGASL